MPELTITALTHAGEGVGRHEGRVVFVPCALPGETVQVELVEVKKHFARGKLRQVLVAAPERVAPRCPHHFQLDPPAGPGAAQRGPACGGCQLQHLDYAAQLAFKQQLVREQLQRIGGFAEGSVDVRPTRPAPDPYHYRNHSQFALTPEGQLGLMAANSHRVLPIRECHQLEPALGALYPRIAVDAQALPEFERLGLRAGAGGEALIVFEGAPEAPEIELDLPISVAALREDGSALTLAGHNHLVMEVRGRALRVSPGSFFQVNTAQAGALVELVLEGLGPALGPRAAVLDLYCGVGLFSAFLAPRVGRLVGVEAYPPAVADAAANLDEFDHVELYEAPVEDALPALAGPFAAAVLDPPRAGCAPAALEALLATQVARIVYVSCDTATLARDLKRLVAGGYRLEWAQPVDMFPQTHHVETVVLLTRSAVS
ncbi:MAG: class I SAM-dependent RNA methyltransferase [Anaerolineales bacterium]|nr:class I SAM-dependent RNA methyltransferase [Anaerolineales bacterium]